MTVKDMRRTSWPRVLRKDYIARDFEWNNFRGQMSLSILRELTAPLTVQYPFGDVLIADTDYRWLQVALKDQYFWITAMYDGEHRLVNLYFDITNGNCFDDPANPCFEDMCLDIVATENHLLILDREELEEALETGDVSQAEYAHAQKVCEELFSCLRGNQQKVIALCGKAYKELKAQL